VLNSIHACMRPQRGARCTTAVRAGLKPAAHRSCIRALPIRSSVHACAAHVRHVKPLGLAAARHSGRVRRNLPRTTLPGPAAETYMGWPALLHKRRGLDALVAVAAARTFLCWCISAMRDSWICKPAPKPTERGLED
jgi:hypothetical protein